MPGIYAHFLLGNLSCEDFPPAFAKVCAEHRGSFYLGLQGPDPLFYVFWGKKKRLRARAFADYLHHEAFAKTLRYLLDCGAWNSSAAGQAYLCGLIGHFALDSQLHPYINRICLKTRDHFALETRFDRMLMEDEGLEAAAFPSQKLVPKDGETASAASAVLALYRERISGGEVKRAIRSFHALRRLMRNKTQLKASITKAFLQLFGLLDPYLSMLQFPAGMEAETHSLRLCQGEDGVHALDKMKALFTAARPLYIQLIFNLEAYLNKDGELHPYFDRNFES